MYNESFKLIQEELATISKHPTKELLIAAWENTDWDKLTKVVGWENKEAIITAFCIPLAKKLPGAKEKLSLYGTYLSDLALCNASKTPQAKRIKIELMLLSKQENPTKPLPSQSEAQQLNTLIMDL